MPEHVRIREVGPRDGFQNEPEVIATDDKVRLVELLARTGVKRLEVTSFVRADVIPQLADGAEVLRRADIPDDVAVTVLIPNERGLDNALALRDALAPSAPGGGRTTIDPSIDSVKNSRDDTRKILGATAEAPVTFVRGSDPGRRPTG